MDRKAWKWFAVGYLVAGAVRFGLDVAEVLYRDHRKRVALVEDVETARESAAAYQRDTDPLGRGSLTDDVLSPASRAEMEAETASEGVQFHRNELPYRPRTHAEVRESRTPRQRGASE